MKIIKPVNYIPPTYFEIEDLIKEKELKLDRGGKDFVIDLASKYAGGEFDTPENISESMNDEAMGLAGKFNDTGFNAKNERLTNIKRQLNRKYASLIDALKTIDLSDIRGETPIDRAINFSYLFNKLGGNKEALDRAKGFLSLKNKKELKELLDLDIDNLGSLPDDFFDNRLDIVCTISAKFDIIIPVKGISSLKKDVEGDILKHRPIKNINELKKIKKRNLALLVHEKDLFWNKLINKEFTVKERFSKVTKKQLIFILIDSSGSMDGERFSKALGVLVNRIQAVKRKEAELYFAFFDGYMHGVHTVVTDDDCKSAMKFVKHTPSGGSTNTGAAVKSAIDFIDNKMKRDDLLKPELLVITDDDGSISDITLQNLNNTKIHGITVASSNSYLKQLAINNKGIYLQL